MAFSEAELIQQIEERTGLFFQEKNSLGNLCLRMENHELRNAFKEVFTSEDLRFYRLAFGANRLILPKSSDYFWKMVEIGKNKTL